MLPWLKQVAGRWPSGIGIACTAASVTCQARSVASVIVASRQSWRSGHQFAGSREGHPGFLHPRPRLRAGAVEVDRPAGVLDHDNLEALAAGVERGIGNAEIEGEGAQVKSRRAACPENGRT